MGIHLSGQFTDFGAVFSRRFFGAYCMRSHINQMKSRIPSYSGGIRPVIFHSDRNNFYTSVDILYDPTLRDKPMAVVREALNKSPHASSRQKFSLNFVRKA